MIHPVLYKLVEELGTQTKYSDSWPYSLDHHLDATRRKLDSQNRIG